MTQPADGGVSRRDADSSPRLSPGATWTGLLLLVALIWGNSFVAIKHIVQYVSPLELVTVRFVPVALIFAVLLLPTRWREIVLLVREESWRLALLGLRQGFIT